jgi:hypothetical protein
VAAPDAPFQTDSGGTYGFQIKINKIENLPSDVDEAQVENIMYNTFLSSDLLNSLGDTSGKEVEINLERFGGDDVTNLASKFNGEWRRCCYTIITP